MTTAMVFPGMGPVPFDEVGRFMLANTHARELVETADEVLGYALIDALYDSADDYSEAAQVSFLVNSLASAQWACETLDVDPSCVAGASFGSKAAVAFVGSIEVAEAIRITAELARVMDTYFAEEFTDIVTHSFVRTPAAVLAEIRAELDARGVWNEISSHFDEDFHMLSLPESEVDALSARLRASGALSLYTMRPPLHCAAFTGLRDRAQRDVLSTVEFKDPRLPVIADHDGSVLRTGQELEALVLDNITKALHWPVVVDSLLAQGVRRVCVAGPDRLFGRVACTTSNFEVLAATPRLAMTPRRRAVA
jgi:[acyl-carrier-protein] S-malonyltransferase